MGRWFCETLESRIPLRKHRFEKNIWIYPGQDRSLRLIALYTKEEDIYICEIIAQETKKNTLR